MATKQILAIIQRKKDKSFSRRMSYLLGNQGEAHVSRSRLNRQTAQSRSSQAKTIFKGLSGLISTKNASTWPNWLPYVQAPSGGPSGITPSAKPLMRSWKGRMIFHRILIRPPRRSYKNVPQSKKIPKSAVSATITKLGQPLEQGQRGNLILSIQKAFWAL